MNDFNLYYYMISLNTPVICLLKSSRFAKNYLYKFEKYLYLRLFLVLERYLHPRHGP